MSTFISFEGIEGSGKTTQLRRLAENLRRRGGEVCLTREPGGCPIADDIRRILLHPDSRAMVPRAELFLYAAARAQHVEEIIRPALELGQVVLCDRFIDATLAYQGFGRRLDRQLIEDLNRQAAGGLMPRMTLLLDLPVEVGLRRARDRNALAFDAEGRFEEESLDFHRRVRRGYLELARRHPERIRIVEADGTGDEVASRIEKICSTFFGEAW